MGFFLGFFVVFFCECERHSGRWRYFAKKISLKPGFVPQRRRLSNLDTMRLLQWAELLSVGSAAARGAGHMV